MFALTKKTDYALIALCHMAQHPEELCTARDMAGRYNMPTALVMNVLKTLNHSKIIRSIRGAKGGYTLAMPAEQITLSDIIIIVEGPVRFVQCAAGARSTTANCGLADSCPVTKAVNRVHEELNDFLKQVTLERIAYGEEYGNGNRECLRLGVAANSE